MFQVSPRPFCLSSGAITVNINWLHCADHQLAPLTRSQGGSIRAITEWLHIGDH